MTQSSPTQARELIMLIEHYFGETGVEEARRTAGRIQAELAKSPGPLSAKRVLTAYGGGKDSTYTVAFMRLVQLELHEAAGETFILVIVTNRHPGMPSSVLHNIDRTYSALAVYGDATVEPLLVDGQEISPFDPRKPLPATLVDQSREDILMAGHRSYAEARATFCISCNFSMLNAFARAARHGLGADLIVTGDSPSELEAYVTWTDRTRKRLHVIDAPGAYEGVRAVACTYYTDLHGSHRVEAVRRRGMPDTPLPRDTRLFTIYADTRYDVGSHWYLLVESLGFEFDEVTLAFSGTETDCANPSLMAHLRGLKAEHLHGRSYDDGINDYLRLVLHLMRQKQFPDLLIEQVRSRYASAELRARMRARVNRYAEEAFGLSERHLVCMVYSPFAGRGANLERYLKDQMKEHAHLAGAIHELLSGARPFDASGASLAALLEEASSLTFAQIATLYGSPLVEPLVRPAARSEWVADRGSSPLAVLLEDDPHQLDIVTQHAPDGPLVIERITGR